MAELPTAFPENMNLGFVPLKLLHKLKLLRFAWQGQRLHVIVTRSKTTEVRHIQQGQWL